MGKKLVVRTKFCVECGKPLRSDATLLLCRPHGEKIRNSLYLEKNRERLRLRSEKYRSENIEKLREYDRRRNKLPHRIVAHKKYENYRLKNDLQFRLAKYLRNTVYIAVVSNKEHKKASEFLGCSVYYYRKYLESKFDKGMAWDNYGQWHIDHIKPLFKFDLKDKKEFLSAAHYTNTQPLWAKDNLTKRDIELRGTN